MNNPIQTSSNGVAQLPIAAVRSALVALTVTNTSGADRWYVLFDATALPALGRFTTTCLRSDRVPAGGTWKPLDVGSPHGAPFTSGIYLASFASNPDGTPNYAALSPADANVNPYSAPLQ